MDVLTNRSVIKEIMEKNGFTFKKSLGQNFIVNPSICPRIAEMGGLTPEMGVIEVGAGIGVLTAELAKRAKKVVCIEIDDRLFPVLDETLKDFDNIKLIHNDILKVDLPKLIAEEFVGMEVCVCANLPYYITSPIIMNLLEQNLPIKSITVMVQKEAADRICAAPGTRECGAISAAISYYATPEVLFKVSKGSFMPPPNVDSAVIKLTLHDKSLVHIDNEKLMFKIVRGAFSQRRKTILNTLSSSMNVSKEETANIINSVGLSTNLRAEALTLDDFAKLTHKFDEYYNK